MRLLRIVLLVAFLVSPAVAFVGCSGGEEGAGGGAAPAEEPAPAEEGEGSGA